jgi:hypothetical protein
MREFEIPYAQLALFIVKLLGVPVNGQAPSSRSFVRLPKVRPSKFSALGLSLHPSAISNIMRMS